MSRQLQLTDREWQEFVLGELFEITSTSSSIDKKRLTGTIGDNPYITRSENNNGIDSFIDHQSSYKMDEANVITIGLDTQTVFYQSAPFYTGQNIQIVRHSQLNKYNALFVIRAIRVLVQKFSWGSYGATLTRLRRGKVFLPVKADGTPDWAFMEAYMKQVEEELLSRVRPKLEEQLLEHIISLGALEDREWSEFVLTDFFNPIKGNQNNMASLIDGELPLISAKKGDNGVKAFVSPNKKSLFPKHCITLNLDGDGGAGLAFYQEYSFALDSHVVALYPKFSLDKFCLLFIARSISAQRSRFGHGRAINKSRLNHFLLMLPIQADSTPDWEFMSAFMKKVEQDTLSKALLHFSPKKSEQMLTGGGMRPFFMEDILCIANGVRLTKADMTTGNRPFVGASEACNGITEFIDNTNASINKEVLGVNYNGSVGFSFYHPYEALFSDDVKRVRWKDEIVNNKYTLLYLSTAIAQQRGKYAYGYKFNAQRMKRQIIMLPSQADGTPDYTYMEQTMRIMEYDVLKTYLNSTSDD